MNLKRHLRTTMTVAAVLLLTGAASAVTRTSSSSGDWKNASTWNNQSPPVAGDTAIIATSTTVTVTDAEASQVVTVNSGGILNVQAGGTLTVSSAVTASGILDVQSGSPAGELHASGAITVPGTFNVDGILRITSTQLTIASSTNGVTVRSGGEIVMDGSDPELTLNMANAVELQSGSFFIVDAAVGTAPDATIDGTGSLRGDNPSASIQINASSDAINPVHLRLDNATLAGEFTMSDGGFGGGSDFDNQGFVIADVGGGMILLDASLGGVTDTANGCANPRWGSLRVAGSNAILKFDTPNATGLVSEFYVTGDLKVDGVHVTTTGSLYIAANGQVIPLNGGQCTFTNFCSGSFCSTTGTKTISGSTFNSGSSCP